MFFIDEDHNRKNVETREHAKDKILIIDKTKWLAERVNKDLHRVLHDDN